MPEAPADATTTIAEQLAAQQVMLLETLNGLYDDATLLVGRILCDRRDATVATARSVTLDGIELHLTGPDGDDVATVPLPAPLNHLDELFLLFFALVIEARERSGEEGTTSVEQVIASASGYRTFLTSVSAVEDVNPHLRQVTFQGGGLTDGFAPVGPDTFLYLLLPPPGRTELTIGADFSWEAARSMPPEDQPVGAYYTLRRWRPEEAELDILMVLHGDTGPASAWAERVAVGDEVALWGPRTSWSPPAGTDSYLLVADETGLPAVAVILETLPAGVPTQVVAEVDDISTRQELPSGDHITVTWLHRDGAEAGTTTALADTVRSLPQPSAATYVWGGAESRAVTQVRRHVRDTWGLPKDQVSLVGYWRHRAHEHDPDLED
ncbi:siderophore-interacting protein [Aquihabitans sp. G128]|uniref:siderophore-interacting protein n=1 Tax=Aquihabitans sp. G128 TaxID=2849779 RepID=UPI001C23A61C|nr:siderophore-interacting protein [Aquihabitans sp. G128]QXC59672.1 siderophore-interacting protein [Aquihabitans sp. G128]